MTASSVVVCTDRVSAAAVVALKRFEHAKSRLRPLPDPWRRRLAWAMATDTLRALGDALSVVVVVSDQPGLAERLAADGVRAEVLPEPEGAGLNAALRSGAGWALRRGHRVVVASVADLPALDPAAVRAVLRGSTGYQRSFVADASGVGTTLLVAREAVLDPRFSGRSAQAHRRSGAVPLDPVPPAARRDVDTEADLAEAYRLGLGPATAALFGPDGRLRR